MKRRILIIAIFIYIAMGAYAGDKPEIVYPEGAGTAQGPEIYTKFTPAPFTFLVGKDKSNKYSIYDINGFEVKWIHKDYYTYVSIGQYCGVISTSQKYRITFSGDKRIISNGGVASSGFDFFDEIIFNTDGTVANSKGNVTFAGNYIHYKIESPDDFDPGLSNYTGGLIMYSGTATVSVWKQYFYKCDYQGDVSYGYSPWQMAGDAPASLAVNAFYEEPAAPESTSISIGNGTSGDGDCKDWAGPNSDTITVTWTSEYRLKRQLYKIAAQKTGMDEWELINEDNDVDVDDLWNDSNQDGVWDNTDTGKPDPDSYPNWFKPYITNRIELRALNGGSIDGLFAEGENQIKVEAGDDIHDGYVDYNSDDTPLNYDSSPPLYQVPFDIAYNLTGIRQTPEDTYVEYTFNWPQGIFADQSSGMFKFYADFQAFGGEFLDLETNSTTRTFTERKATYTFTLVAKDKVGNIGFLSIPSQSVSKDFTTIPYAMDISIGQKRQAIRNENGEPVYTINLLFGVPGEDREYLKNYLINKSIRLQAIINNGSPQPTIIYLDFDYDKIFDSSTHLPKGLWSYIDNNLSYELVFTGKLYAHKEVTFTLTTIFVKKPDGSEISEQSSMNPSTRLPNYLPNAVVDIIKDGSVISTYDLKTGIAAPDGAEEPILIGRNTTFSFMSPELIPGDNLSAYDIEDDPVTATIFSVIGENITGLGFNDPKSMSTITTLSGSKNYIVQFIDYGHEEDGQTIQHNAGPANLYYDADIPSEPAFTVFDINDRSKMLDEYTGTNTNWVVLSDIEVHDAGEAGSGIKRILIWNGENAPQNFITITPLPPNTNVIDLSSSEELNSIINGNTGIIIDSQTLGIQGAIPDGELALEIIWPFTVYISDWEKISQISMKAMDLASNDGEVMTKNIRFDTKPPEAPGNLDVEYTYSEDYNTVNVAIAGIPEEIRKYYYNYEFTDSSGSIPSENLYDISAADHENVSGDIKITIPVSARWNKCVKLALWAEDSAGNISMSSAIYEVFSPALPYSILNRAIVNDLDSANKIFMILIPGGDAAGAQKLVPLMNELPTAIRIQLEEGRFRYDNEGAGLTGHTPYSFKIAAINQNNRERLGDTIFTFTPPNHDVIPSAAADMKPEEGSFKGSANISFSWNPFTDPDSDQVKYRVYCRKTGQPEYTMLTPTSGITENTLAPDTFFTGNEQDGDTFEWHLEAWDDHEEGGTPVRLPETGSIEFTIDNTSPEVEIELDASAEYINSIAVPVNIRETVGLSSFKYIDSDAQGNGNEVSVSIEELVATGQGLFTYNIPLINEGTRRIEAIAADKAGNDGRAIVSLKIDRRNPDTTGVTLDLPRYNNQYICADGVLRISGAFDTCSGIKGVTSYFKAENDATRYGEQYTQITYSSGDTGIMHFEILFSGDASIVNGKMLVLEFSDWAGNKAVWQSSEIVVMDFGNPRITRFEAAGLDPYIHTLENVTVEIEASDPKAGIAKTEYAIGKADGTLASGWNESWNALAETLTDPATGNTTLEAGMYLIKARVTNTFGLESYAESKTFGVDTTPPTFTVTVLPEGSVAPGQTIRITMEGADPESGIKQWSIAIGSIPGATDVSLGISGNTSGWLVSQANPAELTMSLPEDLVSKTYYIRVKALNLAGLEASNEGSDKQLQVAEGETIIVKDNGNYTPDPTRLTSTWEYRGTREISSYLYEALNESDTLIAQGTAGTNTNITIESLSLVHGSTYRFRITGTFVDGGSLTGESIGIKVDTTEPLFITEGEKKDLDYSLACKSDSLFVSWNQKDPESGIAKAEALVERYNSSGELETISGGWIQIENGNALLDKTVTGENLPMTTGDRIYVTIRITNGAGATTDKATPLIIIDDTQPAKPLVFDNGEIVNTASFPSVWTTWKWSEGDPESGIAKYIWTVTRTKTEAGLASWQEEKENTTVYIKDHSLLAGITEAELHTQLWYVAVRAINGSGIESETGWSDGVRFDRTAPFIADVKLLFLGQGQDAADISYLNLVNVTGGLALSIKAYEDIAGNISSFGGAYLTWNAETSAWNITPYTVTKPVTPQDPAGIIPLTGLDITPALLSRFRGSAINLAGMEAEYGYTGGLVYDNTIPEATDIHVFGTGDSFHFDWNVRETETITPITTCKVAFVSSTYTPTEADFIDNPYGLYSYIQPKATLGSGEYRLAIKIMDAAGNYRITYSQALRNDNTPPAVRFDSPKGYDPFVSRTLETNTVATEDISGITEIQYRIGTFEEPGTLSNGWISLVLNLGAGENKIQRTFCFPGYTGTLDAAKISIERNLTHDDNLYLEARARNSQGVWSGNLRSTAILVDLTPPISPTLAVEDVTANPNLIKMIDGTFDSKDPESGVTYVRLAVVPDKDASSDIYAALAVAPSVPISDMIDLIILPDLQHEATRYIAAQTRNGAGDWSGYGVSNRFTVDLAPPEIQTDQANYIANDVPFSLSYTIDEAGSIKFILFDKSNILVSQTEADIPLAGEYSYTFNTAPDAYDTYKLVAARVEDTAGNLVTDMDVATIRLNAPPVIQFGELVTNPGKPYTLDANVYDPDGDGIKTYQWLVERDGTYVALSEPLAYSGSIAFDTVFDHSSPESQVTEYEVMLRVIDKAEKRSENTAILRVVNTGDGTLYTDEVWTGDHLITGNIYVPEGRKLTIDGANCHVRNFYGRGEIFIEVRGTIVMKNNARIYLDTEAQYPYWTGVYVYGTGTITSSTISNARFGVTTLPGSTVTITASTFNDNEIGMRVHGSTPTITGCTISGSTIYGIKEDAGGQPLVVDCLFGSNLYDYYDTEKLVLEAEEINSLHEGNSGNRRVQ